MEDSTLLRWHSGTQKRVERAKQSDQIDNEARLLWKSIVKTKHQSLTNLAFMRLVPGADRVVRHICIRCIADLSFAQQVFTFRKATSFWSHLLVIFKDESASSSDSRKPAYK